MTRRLIARVTTDRKKQQELLYDDKGQLVKKNHVQNLCADGFLHIHSFKTGSKLHGFTMITRLLLSSASCTTAK